jgi:hypothetical protein
MVSMVCAHNDGIISDMPPHACWYVLASAWVCLLPFCALSHIFILTVFCKLNFSNLSARRSAAKIWIQRLRKLYTLVVKERIPVAPRRAPLAHRLYEMQSRQIEDVSDITPATVLWWRQAWESIKAQWPVLLTADTLLAIQAGTGFWKFQGCETRNAQGITRACKEDGHRFMAALLVQIAFMTGDNALSTLKDQDRRVTRMNRVQ